MRRIVEILVVFVLCSCVVHGAEENYYVVSVDKLKLTEGQLPARLGWRASNRLSHQIRVTMKPEGEIYLIPDRDFREGSQLAIRMVGDLPVSGRMFLPADIQKREKGVVKFRIPAGVDNVQNPKEKFYELKSKHYANLLNQRMPGAAWFRHRVDAARKRAGLKETDREGRSGRRRGRGDLRDTYALFSGGRAVSENLQLDRMLRRAEGKPTTTIDIDKIEGITVSEMEWESLIKGLDPEKDPLARLIPADQHALFFPSFSKMLTLLDDAKAQGTPVLRLLEPRSENARTHERYETQLCLKTNVMSRLLGPKLVKSVAFTGADPYLRTGADVAVLFEARDPATLYKAIRARQDLAAREEKVKQVKESVGDRTCEGVRSPDRSVCSYVTRVGETVVVTNSMAQMRRILATADGERRDLASLPEYTFFRNRYKRGASEETGLLVLSDATIRRWCSARWRIGASRRLRMGSLMADLQAQNLDQTLKKKKNTELHPDAAPVPDSGKLRVESGEIRSSRYGTTEFLTPILELDIQEATKSEAQAYRRWRRGYQSNFSQVFDPIAIRFNVKPKSIAADMTVMPLIDDTDYGEMLELTAGATIGPDAGDPHEGTLVHFVMSIDRKAEPVQEVGDFGPLQSPQFGTSPLSWLGESLAVYADRSRFWSELAKTGDANTFFQSNIHRLPVILHVGVSSSMRLTAFLASIKGFIQQSAPGMTVWETHEHNDQNYVSIRPTSKARRNMPGDAADEFAVYYAPSPSALRVTLNEKMLKEALDRQARRNKSKDKNQAQKSADEGDWLGRNLCLKADRELLNLIEPLEMGSYQEVMQRRAWGNIPILNEWKRLFPKRNPVKVHQQFWDTRLVCPGGGRYVWNKKWQTMESTAYGHPGQPKSGPGFPPEVERLQNGNFGVTFENDGLRARVRLNRKAAPEAEK